MRGATTGAMRCDECYACNMAMRAGRAAAIYDARHGSSRPSVGPMVGGRPPGKGMRTHHYGGRHQRKGSKQDSGATPALVQLSEPEVEQVLPSHTPTPTTSKAVRRTKTLLP